MGQWFIGFLASGLAFLALDAAWLSYAASRIYRPRLAPMLREDFVLLPAAAFYVIYIVGILVFAVAPALGFVAYATYDLTNQATLRHWSGSVTLIDMAWGTILTGGAALAGYAAIMALSPRG